MANPVRVSNGLNSYEGVEYIGQTVQYILDDDNLSSLLNLSGNENITVERENGDIVNVTEDSASNVVLYGGDTVLFVRARGKKG